MKNYGRLRDLNANNFPDHPVQTPEDLYSKIFNCPECGAEWSHRNGLTCPDCGVGPEDYFDPPDPGEDDYRSDYPERYGLI